ncbi:hypothetical protein NUW58_g2372 [Xylaria curta]|uniref:Uncharacterized protein n=1 Tax=Xylaria curta TaxID=42375 RepID=A0ACC1PFW3_9PEZI|nr:hypothetical protein NUW58_g2372 [Xylaria curta]
MASPGASGVDLSHIPLSKPPPGEVTNFVNPESISWAGRLSIYLTLPIMVIAFTLRLYVRIQKRRLGADDHKSCGASTAGVVFRYRAFDFEVEDNRYLSIQFEALSVAELNIGILCACIPVFFVLFKTAARRTEYGFIYLKEHFSPRGSGRGDIAGREGTHHPKIEAQVPSGTLNRLKSIFRKVGRTQAQGTEALTDLRTSDFLELQSADYDYHAHIRRGSHTASTKSLIKPRSNV